MRFMIVDEDWGLEDVEVDSERLVEEEEDSNIVNEDIVIAPPKLVEMSTIQTCSPMMATKPTTITDYFAKLQRLPVTQPQKKMKMEEEYPEFLDCSDFEELTEPYVGVTKFNYQLQEWGVSSPKEVGSQSTSPPIQEDTRGVVGRTNTTMVPPGETINSDQEGDEDDLFWSGTSRYMGWLNNTPSLSTTKAGEDTFEEEDSVFEDEEWFSTQTLGYLDLTTTHPDGRVETGGCTGPDSSLPVTKKRIEDDIGQKEDNQLEIMVEDLMTSCLEDNNDSWLYKSTCLESPDNQEDRRVVPGEKLYAPPPPPVLDMGDQIFNDQTGSTVEQAIELGSKGEG